MTAEIVKILKKKSHLGGYFYNIFFKSLTGKGYYTCIHPKFKNFIRWNKILDIGVTLTGLKLTKNNSNLINADSNFKIVEK